MVKFYLSNQGQQFGPLSFNEIVKMLEENVITGSDYIFDNQSGEWVTLAEHHLLFTFFNSTAPNEKILKDEGKTALIDSVHAGQKINWFVLKGNEKLGPFTYFKLVRMLQERSLVEFDQVWTANRPGWTKISSCNEFSPEAIRHLKNSNFPEVEDIFFRRRHPRVAFGAPVRIHNCKAVWNGKSTEISAGGVGLLVDNQNFEPGQNLFLYFTEGDKVPPFNAICTIVSKQYISSAAKEIKYGFKFTNVSRDIRFAIKAYTENAA